ncbi:MAG: hypothetical protein ACJA1H_002626 [Glaciecola sp.]|jgi:hypothetical protein
MLDGEDPSTLIPLVMLASYTNNNSQASINFLNIFAESAYAQDDTTSHVSIIRTCFMEATGIAAGLTLVAALTAQTMDKQLVKKLMKKVLKKVGARVLGGIGLVLIIADFSYCVATFEDV